MDLFLFFSDNHDNKFKALNTHELFGSTFTHYLAIAFENVIFYFYVVSAKNNYKSYGSVLYMFYNQHGRSELKTIL